MIPLALALAAAPAVPPALAGTWHNPKQTVAVRTGACGDRVCAWVVRASDKARADAARGSGRPLIGTALLRGYRASGQGRWAGQVYIPDMNRTFGSTIQVVDADTLNVRGCLIGGFVCKSQLWRRD